QYLAPTRGAAPAGRAGRKTEQESVLPEIPSFSLSECRPATPATAGCRPPASLRQSAAPLSHFFTLGAGLRAAEAPDPDLAAPWPHEADELCRLSLAPPTDLEHEFPPWPHEVM
ncbi:unnamed protein product, partial [Polarella glacialis]